MKVLILIFALALDLARTAGQQSTNAPSTDEMLASAEEDIGDQIQELAPRISDATTAVSTKLNSTIEAVVISGVAVLGVKADDLDEQVEAIDERLDEIEVELASSELFCSEISDCGTCTSNSTCVWCSIEQTCQAGDENGPSNGACSIFNYENCGGLGCREYTNCNDCIDDPNCGWCLDNIPKCNKASAVDNGGCSKNNFYYSTANNECPANSHVPYKGRNTGTRQELEAEQSDLETQRSNLESMINQYESESQDLEKQGYIAEVIYIPDVVADSSINDIVDVVTGLEDEETEELQTYEGDIQTNMTTAIDNATDADVQNRTEYVVAGMEQVNETLTDDLVHLQGDQDKEMTALDHTWATMNETSAEELNEIEALGVQLDGISSSLGTFGQSNADNSTNSTQNATGTSADTTTGTTATTFIEAYQSFLK